MDIFILYLILSIGVGYVAHKRGRRGWLWFLLATELTPVIMLFWLLALPKLEMEET